MAMAGANEGLSRAYPKRHLEEALEIAQAIREKNSGLPFNPTLLAESMGTTPRSSTFMMKVNSSERYGLTEGKYNDSHISLTELGRRATETEADAKALVEAAMRPDTFRTFYETLNGERVPAADAAVEIIENHVGVQEKHAQEFLDIAAANGKLVGIVREMGKSDYVVLADLSEPNAQVSDTGPIEGTNEGFGSLPPVVDEWVLRDGPSGQDEQSAGSGRLLAVHSGAGEIADRIVQMLDRLEVPHGVVEVDPIDSSALSAEMVSEMEGCSGAVVVMAGPGRTVSTPGAASSRASKMLLHLGAAVSRFGDRVVMVVGPESDHFLQTVRIQRVYIEIEDSGRFELGLLQGLMDAGMVVVSTPGRIS